MTSSISSSLSTTQEPQQGTNKRKRSPNSEMSLLRERISELQKQNQTLQTLLNHHEGAFEKLTFRVGKLKEELKRKKTTVEMQAQQIAALIEENEILKASKTQSSKTPTIKKLQEENDVLKEENSKLQTALRWTQDQSLILSYRASEAERHAAAYANQLVTLSQRETSASFQPSPLPEQLPQIVESSNEERDPVFSSEEPPLGRESFSNLSPSFLPPSPAPFPPSPAPFPPSPAPFPPSPAPFPSSP